MVENTEKEQADAEQARDATNEQSCNLCANLAEFISGKEIVLKLEVTLNNDDT